MPRSNRPLSIVNTCFVSLSVTTRGRTATGTVPRSLNIWIRSKLSCMTLTGISDIIWPGIGKLLGQLLCRAHLIDHDGICHRSCPDGIGGIGRLRRCGAAARRSFSAVMSFRLSSFISEADR